MVSDIKLLKDKILVYYNKYAEIPKTDREITIDGTLYYEIDLSKIEGLTLNYGNEYGETIILSNSSDVYVADMTDKEIEAWVDTGKAYDKAGAYAMQLEFAKHIEKINGNYDSIIGLPINKVYNILKEYI